ncbi:sigma-70 family RNA polymerase sigma factor [Thermomonas mangrovi]|uniref:sigma-70 family RNA polymerase sigma factor n=1 Tax=Thermomonas mangrovi TaxID=2993316 RepID=UPI0023078CD4|nr:sigma-70 family RNA polymerase sigma factor [Thermomonas mangrovi]
MPPSLDAEAPFDAPDDWGAWMARAQAGDQQDYRRLLQAIGPYLRAIARRMLGQDEAEDAVQEILLVVHGVRHTYEPGRPFRPWLSTIATRRCIDILRRRQREGLRVGDALALEAQADEAPDPLERLEQAQRGERLHAAVAGLSPGQRDAVRLLHLQELSLREAEAHGRQRAGALKVASHRALKALRRALQGDEDAR